MKSDNVNQSKRSSKSDSLATGKKRKPAAGRPQSPEGGSGPVQLQRIIENDGLEDHNINDEHMDERMHHSRNIE